MNSSSIPHPNLKSARELTFKPPNHPALSSFTKPNPSHQYSFSPASSSHGSSLPDWHGSNTRTHPPLTQRQGSNTRTHLPLTQKPSSKPHKPSIPNDDPGHSNTWIAYDLKTEVYEGDGSAYPKTYLRCIIPDCYAIRTVHKTPQGDVIKQQRTHTHDPIPSEVQGCADPNSASPTPTIMANRSSKAFRGHAKEIQNSLARLYDENDKESPSVVLHEDWCNTCKSRRLNRSCSNKSCLRCCLNNSRPCALSQHSVKKMHVKKAPRHQPYPSQLSGFDGFFSRLNLQQYKPVFVANGFETLKSLKSINKDVLDELGITKVGHRVQILHEIGAI